MIETEIRRRETAQAAHRFLKRNNFFFANVFAEKPGEVSDKREDALTTLRTRLPAPLKPRPSLMIPRAVEAAF